MKTSLFIGSLWLTGLATFFGIWKVNRLSDRKAETSSHHLSDSQVVSLEDNLNYFGAELVKRFREYQAQRDSENPMKSDAKFTNTYSFLSSDIRKDGSLATPVFGVIRLRATHTAESTTGNSGGFGQIITINLQPTENGKWKCLKVEFVIEWDLPFPGSKSRGGNSEDNTDYFREMIEK